MEKTKTLIATIGATLFLVLPALAQDAKQDPHAHDWYNEQVKGKVDPTTGEKLPSPTSETATGQPATSSPANDVLNKSLGSVDKNYHGQSQNSADDQIGLYVVGGLAVLVIGGIALATRKKKKPDQAEK